MKKILCTLLVVFMMVSVLAACSGTPATTQTGTGANTGTQGTTPTVTVPNTDYDGDPVVFPLEEEVTFTMMIPKVEEAGNTEEFKDSYLYKKLYEETNVNIELMYMTTDLNTQLALAFQSGTYGDFYAGGSGNVIPTNNAVDYFDSGKFVPITKYINPVIMPNFYEDLMELPEMLGMITAPDGEIYTLPKLTGWGPQCHETPMWINKTWLDNLGIDVPETLDELEAALKAFAAQDANGNGDTSDEIAWLVSDRHNNMHLEALYGLWGYGVKQGVNDMYLQIIDGEVIFSVEQPEWQEYLTWVKDLYDAGAVYSECFTASNDTINNIFNATTSQVGFVTHTYHPDNTEDEWIPLAPVENGDYTCRWFYNCACWGSKGQFYVTDKCENVDILCAWMDKFFDLENAWLVFHNPVNFTQDENGVYKLTEVQDKEAKYWSVYVGSNWPAPYMPSDYQYIDTSSVKEQQREEAYELYKDAINTEIWPRPYWTLEQAEDVGTLATPIDNCVKQWRCDFITGEKDIYDDWEEYLDDLDGYELDLFMEHAQAACDVVFANIQALKNK